MTVTSVQCPKCGSPITSPRVGGTMSCPSCGSTLAIGMGSSGHPLAELVTIGRDTGFLARQQAAERLKGQLQRLQAQRASMESDLRQAEDGYSATPMPWGLVVFFGSIGLVAIAQQGAATYVGAFFLGTAAAIGVVTITTNNKARRDHEAHVSRVRAEIENRIANITTETEACRADLARVEADLDRMAREF